MPKPTGPTSQTTGKLIADFRKSKDPMCTVIARHLEKPARTKRSVNIQRLAKLSRRYDVFVVPGKVLSLGELKKPVSVYALSYSTQAREKIKNAKGHAYPLGNLLKDRAKARLVI